MFRIFFSVVIVFSTLNCSNSYANTQLSLNLCFLPSAETAQNKAIIKLSISNIGESSVIIPLLFMPEDHYVKFDVIFSDNTKAKFIGKELDWINSPLDYSRFPANARYEEQLDLTNFYAISQEIKFIRARYYAPDYLKGEGFEIWKGEVYSGLIRPDDYCKN